MSRDEAVLLAVFSLGAFFMPLVSRWLRLPLAVGEISLGLVMGFFFKGILESMPMIKFLSGLGFLLLMYLAGLEINFVAIKASPKKNILQYLLFFVLLGACSWSAAAWLSQPPLYALLYFTCAIGLLFPVLKDEGLLKSDYGQQLLVLGSIGEVLTLLALSGFMLYVNYGLTMKMLVRSSGLVFFFGTCYLIARLFRLYVWWNPKKTTRFLQTGDSAETGIRTNLANMFLFVSFAVLFEMKLIIGAFFGGMLFALLFARREEIKERLSAFAYGFLVPIFFIEVGLRFNLQAFFSWRIFWQAALISLVILLVRAVSCLGLLFSRFSLRELLFVPFSLSFPLTLMVAVAAVGLQENIIAKREGTVIILASILTALVYPWCFKLLLPRSGSPERTA